MIKRFLPFIKKEFIEIVRDKLSFTSVLFLPSILLFLYGYAISLDIKEIKISLLDMDKDNFSKSFIDNLISSGYFRIVSTPDSMTTLSKDIRTSKAQMGIIIYPNTQNNLLNQNETSIQIIVDGTNAQSSQYTLNYLMMNIERFTKITISNLNLLDISSIKRPELIERVLYNPLLKSPLYLIPGLIAFVIMIVGAISTTISIVREKENKTTEQIILCPISPSMLIIGKIIPYFFISLISSIIMITLSMLFFDLPLRGSILFLFFSVTIFLLCALGFGILISTISDSQQVAFTIATFATLLPTITLSGFIFPINNMPKIIQIIAYIVPARYFITILRGILLKGSTIIELKTDTLLLSLYAILVIVISVIRIKKKGLII